MENVMTMTKTKAKSVIIDGDIHGKLKRFCKGKSLKIGGVLEDLIEVYLDDYRGMQQKIDEYKDKNNKF